MQFPPVLSFRFRGPYMKTQFAVISAIVYACLVLPSAVAQHAGSVRGTVLDENGIAVVAARVSVDPLDGRPRASAVREAETDKNGHFAIDNLELGAYGVFAMKESSGYADTASAFYRDHVFPTATLTADVPAVDLIVKIGPPAVVITGLVTDATTNKPLDTAFLLRRAADPDNWISLSQRPRYRVLVPPLTDVSFEVSAPGYKTYYYGGASDSLRRPPVRLESGQEMRLDIQLEPEEKTGR
jgi:hypothetical protein